LGIKSKKISKEKCGKVLKETKIVKMHKKTYIINKDITIKSLYF